MKYQVTINADVRLENTIEVDSVDPKTAAEAASDKYKEQLVQVPGVKNYKILERKKVAWNALVSEVVVVPKAKETREEDDNA